MERLQQIKKRTGEIVPFEKAKVENAISKAFKAVTGDAHEDIVLRVGDQIVDDLVKRFPEDVAGVPSVELVQDLVERHIMEAGFFDVAKAYILYRYEHTKVREKEKEEVVQKIEDKELMVVKRSGKKEPFSSAKIKKALAHFSKGYEDIIDIEGVLKQCQHEVYDEIKTTDITRVLIMVLRSTIERDPAYSKVAANLLLNRIYEQVLGEKFHGKDMKELQAVAFSKYINRMVDDKKFDPRMKEFDLKELASVLDPERDHHFEYMGLEILQSRYLLEDMDTKLPYETPQMFWMRIAMGTAVNEDPKKRMDIAKEFYYVLSNFLYTPGGRTLYQSGVVKAQLSNCFLNIVPDDLHGIFKSYSDNAQLLKWSGGVGTAWSKVRATGSVVKSVEITSQGTIPFLKIANDINVAIMRSGKRRSAACVYLEVWHYDIEEFLELRKNTGDERRRTHDINTANWIPDLFMKRIKEDGDWTLFSPDETPDLPDIYGKKFDAAYMEYERRADKGEIKLFKRMKARDLWKKMLTMLFETGHPWITWKDPSNIRSPQDHVGVIHNSNLCTEITLNTSLDETAVCNIGSVNFAKFVVNGKFDHELIARTLRAAVRMTDNTIDINYYPTEDARRSNMRHRPIGLGIRGYHDALYDLDINFDSQAALDFSDESMEVMAYYTILASSELAKEKGAYESFKGSKWDRGLFPQDTIELLEKERGMAIPIPKGGKLDWTKVRAHVKEFGMRNSNTMAVAPTASTANLVGCIPCVEPIYKNIYVKSNKEGDFVVVNKHLIEDLKKRKLWTKEVLNKLKYHDGSIQAITEIPKELREKYKEVFEIDSNWLIEAAARRAKWIDQSQSLNIFFRGTSGKELADVYFRAWELGLKTTYYLRTLGASQVEKATVSTAEFGSTHKRDFSNEPKMSQPQMMEEGTPSPVKTKYNIIRQENSESEECESCSA